MTEEHNIETSQVRSRFDKVLEARITETRETLAAKANEYATIDDRFHNFNVASRIMRCSPECALWSFATKHLVSVIDLVDMVDQGRDIDIEIAEEKIQDMICYLILLEGLLKR